MFACFEQPDLKGAYTFVVTAPAHWQVISNQAVDHRRRGGDNQTVTFAPTLPISTYITAIVAGPYHRVDSSWSRGELTVPLRVLCRASLAEHLDADEILQVTTEGLDFYAEHFDYPYPFGKYDQVFVPEYNLGAMENPAASPSPRHTSSAAPPPKPNTRAAPTRSCTRWRTCGSATSSP